jgi:hypothetical protein
MKKLFCIVLLSLSGIALAHPPYPYRYYEHVHVYNNDWVTPMVLGGVITYALTRPAQTVIVQQPPVVQTLPMPPVGYHYENILDASCNCYRQVLVLN